MRANALRCTWQGHDFIYHAGVDRLREQYPGAAIRGYADGRPYVALEATPDPETATRAELNKAAARRGVADPEKLPNKGAVAAAIAATAEGGGDADG